MSYNLTVTRGLRRSWSIRVDPPDIVSVKIPFFMSAAQVKDLLKKKDAWIQKRLGQYRQSASVLKPKKYETGEEFRYKGQLIRLVVAPGRARRAVFEENMLIVEVSGAQVEAEREAAVKKKLLAWFKDQAREMLEARVAHFSSLSGIKVNQIWVKDTRSLWGSSSRLGNLNFSWKIIIAPPAVLDYLVIHELSHQVHMNHSKDFWNLVSKFDSDFKAHKKWLRTNGDHLRI